MNNITKDTLIVALAIACEENAGLYQDLSRIKTVLQSLTKDIENILLRKEEKDHKFTGEKNEEL